MMTTRSSQAALLTRLAARLRASWLGRLGLPLGVSLGVHALLAAAVVASAWSARDRLAGGHARAEVVISLPPTPKAPAPGPKPLAAEPAAPASVQVEPPRLQGMTTPSLAPPPVLRSAASDATAPGELLRREDDSALGATFAGLGARRASSVVYVVDASGAMVTSLKFVLAELERSVRSLSSSQSFQVVLFRERAEGAGGAGGFEVFGQGSGGARLVPATAVNKAALSQWLKTITPTGKSNPLDGLKRGLEFDPDAIFLLSRSIRRSSGSGAAESGVWGRGTREILGELDRLNPRRGDHRRVAIKAIQFLEEDPSGTMQAIGEEHGGGPGSYRVLTLQELGGR